MKLPIYSTFQGGNQTRSWLEVPIRYLSMHACTGLIIGTQKEIERVHDRYKIPTSKIARIFNPLEITNWQKIDCQQARKTLGISNDTQVVVWHGRVEIKRKGLDILLEAWHQVCQERPERDLQLLVVGTGSEANQFRQRIQSLQLNNVHWLNEFVSDRSKIMLYLSAANVYAFPSRQEGFPVAPIEAMSCGLPVIAADAPGVPDILEGGETNGGLIVPRGDAKAFASALGKVLDNPELMQTLSVRARDRAVSAFAPEAIGKQLREVLLNHDFKDK